jgi:hypothetical protein
LKKQTAVFIIASTALSLALQFVFAIFFFKISDFRQFSYFRSRIEKAARLSCGTEDSYMDLVKSSGTAILKLPSCDMNNAIIPGKFDMAGMLCRDNTAVFSLYPSELSARKHTSVYVKGINSLSFEYAGGLFEFKCSVKNRQYGRSFFVLKRQYLLPAGAGVF